MKSAVKFGGITSGIPVFSSGITYGIPWYTGGIPLEISGKIWWYYHRLERCLETSRPGVQYQLMTNFFVFYSKMTMFDHG